MNIENDKDTVTSISHSYSRQSSAIFEAEFQLPFWQIHSCYDINIFMNYSCKMQVLQAIGFEFQNMTTFVSDKIFLIILYNCKKRTKMMKSTTI